MMEETVQAAEPPVIETIRVADIGDGLSPVEELAGEDREAAPPVVETPDQIAEREGLMTREQFAKLFAGAHAAAGFGFAMRSGIQLQTLAHADQLDGFRDASDAIYDTAAELPWMRWLLRKEALWMQRGFVIATYFGNLRAALGEEFAVLRAQHEAAQRAAAEAQRQ